MSSGWNCKWKKRSFFLEFEVKLESELADDSSGAGFVFFLISLQIVHVSKIKPQI